MPRSKRPRKRKSRRQQVLPVINPLAKCGSCIFFTVTVKGGYCFRRNMRVSDEAPACRFYLEDEYYLKVSRPVKVEGSIRSIVGRIVVIGLDEVESSAGDMASDTTTSEVSAENVDEGMAS